MIQSVERAIDILNAVARKDDWVGVREIARLVDLKVPTTQQLLKTLQARSFLEFDEERRQYRVCLGVSLLAAACDPQQRLADLARPYVNKMHEEFGETVAVLRWGNNAAHVIDWREATHSLRVAAPSSNRIIEMPHLMASGRVLLAFLEESAINGYIDKIDFSKEGRDQPRNRNEFLKMLSDISGKKYAETDNVCDSGIYALSVPVFDGSGRVLMAFACSLPTIRMNANLKKKILKRLIEYSAEMSGKLL
jgi:DNA-binding IclR family transcriptional regulator